MSTQPEKEEANNKSILDWIKTSLYAIVAGFAVILYNNISENTAIVQEILRNQVRFEENVKVINEKINRLEKYQVENEKWKKEQEKAIINFFRQYQLKPKSNKNDF